MKNKIIAFFLLSCAMTAKPLGFELVAGAVIGKAMTSQPATVARHVAIGYMLNTPMGKKFSQMTLQQMRNGFSRLMFGQNYVKISESSFVKAVPSIAVNRLSVQQMNQAFLKLLYGQNYVANPNGRMTKALTVMKQNVGKLFASNQEQSAAFTSRINKLFNRVVIHDNSSAYAHAATAQAKPNIYSAQQVTGLFPRITNNYYQSNDSNKFWKGFAGGSFSAWTTAWWLQNKKQVEQQKK